MHKNPLNQLTAFVFVASSEIGIRNPAILKQTTNGELIRVVTSDCFVVTNSNYPKISSYGTFLSYRVNITHFPFRKCALSGGQTTVHFKKCHLGLKPSFWAYFNTFLDRPS